MPDVPAPVAFPLWGGTASVLVADPGGCAVALAAVRETCAAFDAACSLFRSDSELVALNAGAGGGPVRVSDLLLDAVLAGVRGARCSDGDVNPDVGSPRARVNGRPLTVGDVAAVQADRRASTVELASAARLDLGATAKALAADRAARAARRALRTAGAHGGVLVGLLGDLACAGPAPAGGWPVRVVGDHRDGEAPGQTITLAGGGMATSSRLVRGDHILDPRTGTPVESDLVVATVAARSCLDANIAATAAIVRGRSRAAAWLTKERLPARLVGCDGRAWHISGWPADGEELPVGDAPSSAAAVAA